MRELIPEFVDDAEADAQARRLESFGRAKANVAAAVGGGGTKLLVPNKGRSPRHYFRTRDGGR